MFEPMPASTVVICRITTKWPHKILLLKRSEQAKFLPGAHVFPGGRLEEFDEKFGAFLATDIVNFTRIAQFFPKDPQRVSAHLAAAIRETFEETCISILRLKSSSARCSKEALKDLINQREILKEHPDLSNIWPISWWVTPLGETRRFDTWFFLALIEDGEELDRFDEVSLIEGDGFLWLSPIEALEKYRETSIFLAPPTRSILERMAMSESLKDFLGYVDCPLSPIHPFFGADHEGNKILILPGDPLHKEERKPRMLLATRYKFP